MASPCVSRPCPGWNCPVSTPAEDRLPVWCGVPHLLHSGAVEETPSAAIRSLDTSRTAYNYMMFNKDGAPVYIGMTFDPARRYDQHQRNSSWIHQVHTWDLYAILGVDLVSTKAAARHWERLAIGRNLPLFNREGSPALPSKMAVTCR